MKAIVVPVTVRPHPNADRVQLATARGYQVVVGLDVKTGDLGILFPPDSQLGLAYCEANGLLRAAGGYFGDNRRVAVQRFRGERSEAFWSPVASLSFTGVDVASLTAGQEIDQLGGVEICRRWVNPETLRARAKGQASGVKGSVNGEVPWFRRHTETDQLRHATASDFPAGSRVFITEKLHGTSHRVGVVPEVDERTGIVARVVARIAERLGYQPARRFRLVSGSRRVVLTAGEPDRFHGGTFREESTAGWAGHLYPGEVVYGEIVGYSAPGSPVMASHTAAASSVDAVRALKGSIVYHYGEPDGACRFYCYRIVQHRPDGSALELAWEQMAARCRDLGIKTVPLLERVAVLVGGFAAGTPDPWLLGQAVKLADAYDSESSPLSTLSVQHPIEGVCVRVERPDGRVVHFKRKSFAFCELEGIAANRPGHVDLEEAA